MAALANVELIDRCDATGLVADERGDRVVGVRLLRPSTAARVLAGTLRA